MFAGIQGPKMVKIRENPDRPAHSVPTGHTSTYMGPIISLEQCDMSIRFQNKVNFSYPVGGPGRHKDQTKDPHARAQNVKWKTTHPRGNVEC